jgi:hypothetical protein
MATVGSCLPVMCYATEGDVQVTCRCPRCVHNNSRLCDVLSSVDDHQRKYLLLTLYLSTRACLKVRHTEGPRRRVRVLRVRLVWERAVRDTVWDAGGRACVKLCEDSARPSWVTVGKGRPTPPTPARVQRYRVTLTYCGWRAHGSSGGGRVEGREGRWVGG